MNSPLLRQAQIQIGRLTRVHAFVCAGVLGLIARFFLAAHCLGSNDITTWAAFGRAIRETSLGHVYDTVPGFNHPPLMGWMAWLAEAVAVRFHVRFDLAFKTPVIFAEWISGFLIYRRWRTHGPAYAALAFLLFAWNPSSFLVSAYHGNTDPLCAMLSLLAGLLIQAENPFWGGLALAGSINVKLIAVLLIPVLLSCAGSSKGAFRFLGALLLGSLPFLPFALFHWPAFHEHVINYNSTPGYWGLTQLLASFRESAGWRSLGTRLIDAYMANGKFVVLAMPAVLAALNLWRGRDWDARILTALAYCLFLAVTPGFGIQYVIYPTVLLFAGDLKQAVKYSVLAGVYAGVTYFALWTRTAPAYSDFSQPYPPASKALAYFLWIALLQITLNLGSRLARAQPGT